MSDFDQMALRVTALEMLLIHVLATDFERTPQPIEAARTLFDQWCDRAFDEQRSAHRGDGTPTHEVSTAVCGLLDRLSVEVEQRVSLIKPFSV